MARIRKRRSTASRRTHYPHEEKYPWLSILLDSYAIHDYEMSKDIAKSEKRRGTKIACHKGCFACCLRESIPITQLELRGISWYVSEIMDSRTQEELRPRLLEHRKSTECPFLLNGLCSIYHVRPLACRNFFVFTTPCKEGEALSVTRPEDIHWPNQAIGKRVTMRFLDFDDLGLTTRREKEEAFERGIMHEMTRPMHSIDWSSFVNGIDLFRTIDGER